MELLEKTIKEINTRQNSRSNSWEICYLTFKKANQNRPINEQTKITLALHLMGYLASWGMYRASSFLFHEYDYLIHTKVIDTLMDSTYKPLFKIKSISDLKKNKDLIVQVYEDIEKTYQSLREESDPPVSKTLITKIILGVYGCLPAYDTNFEKGLAKFKIPVTKQTKVSKRILPNIDALINNIDRDDIVEIVNNIDNKLSAKKKKTYTFMKKIDLYFFCLGAH